MSKEFDPIATLFHGAEHSIVTLLSRLRVQRKEEHVPEDDSASRNDREPTARTQWFMHGKRILECPFCDETHEFDAEDHSLYQLMPCIKEIARVVSTPKIERMRIEELKAQEE